MAGLLRGDGGSARGDYGLQYACAPAPAPPPATNQPLNGESAVLGKAEGKGKLWHGHVTAVTVAPEYRRLGLARRMMQMLEDVSRASYNGFFVDLFVRVSNVVAIGMYRKLGYVVYRQVLGYYSGASPEDAYGAHHVLHDRISHAAARRHAESSPA